MSHECTFDEYYLEIAKECGISLAKHPIARDCYHSNERFFSDTTTIKQWDLIASANQSRFTKACRNRGDTSPSSNGVCILKVMAKHEKELGLYDYCKDKVRL